MESILLPKNFDINKISYGSVKTLDNGGRTIYVSYEGRPLTFQTPEMVAPFGITKWASDGKLPDKYTLELSFKGRDDKPSLSKFYEVLDSLDNKIVQDAFDNSTNWLKKKYNSLEVVHALYTPMIKHPKDKSTGEITDKYPPTFRATLPQKEGSFLCEVYDKNRNRIDLGAMENTKGAKMTAIIQCLGIWIAGSKLGCNWKIQQLMVSPQNAIKGFAFTDEDCEGSKPSKMESPILSDEDADDVQCPDEEVIDEEEEVVEDEDVDVPPPPKTKSVVSQKKKPHVVEDDEDDEIDEEDDALEKKNTKTVTLKTTAVKKTPTKK